MRSRPKTSSSSIISPLSRLPPSPTPRQIQQSHCQLILLGLSSHRFALSHLLSRCAAVPPSPLSSHYPLSLFHQIQTPNVFAFNNLIRCLPPPLPLLLFSSSSLPPNNYTFTFLLHSCAIPLITEGKQIHALLLKLGFGSDVYIRNALIAFYSAAADLHSCRSVFRESASARDLVTWNSMLAACARNGDVPAAENLLDEMPSRDAISWSTMIMGYVQNGALEKGMQLFRRLVLAKRAAINEAAVVSVLSSVAQMGLLECGKFVHSMIKTLKFNITVTVGAALVDMYSKCGCIERARRVFDEMRRRDVFAWNAMLCGLAAHGLGAEALDLFRRFLDGNLRPTGVTFVGVLNACSRVGLVDDGRRFFRSMVEDYGIEPEMEHYGCMVDLLGRAGLVSEAVELVEGMRILPDPVLWGTLLGACKMHGLVEMGEEIGRKLIEVDPGHDGNYVLLAGIYAKGKKWEDVTKVRRLMSKRGAKKVAGWSLIEANAAVHRFVAGDREHEQSSEIYRKLEMIGCRLVEAGYLPDVSQVLHDIGDEEKVHAIKEHSERLAIAFGMMVIDEGQPIRIVKNLRVCGDCHEFTKMAAKVFDREIIVRDGSRFHHFKGGTCSCLDYW